MKPFKRGQIWIVDFDPSVGHEYKKIRPALIIQQERYIFHGSLVTVIPLSSKIAKPAALDVVIKKAPNNRLMKDSLIKTQQMSSFDKSRFIKCIGTLTDSDMKRIDNRIHQFLFGRLHDSKKTDHSNKTDLVASSQEMKKEL